MRDPVLTLAEALTEEAPLKLWSVLVTCLGDVGRSSRAEVSGLVLSALVERIGLQPQAMRVALHRLKRDGWIESRRDGRVGYHALSPSALTQVQAVEDRVYGPAAGLDGWQMVGLPPDAQDALLLLPEGTAGVAVSRGLALVAGCPEGVPEDWLLAVPNDRGLPDWVRSVVVDAACEADFARLTATIRAVEVLPEAPLDRFALRVLALHGWRRLALRSNPAAEAVLGGGRAEIACRAAVHGLMERLGPVQASWLRSGS